MTTRRRGRRNQNGFTLVELLAALAIVAMVMVPVTGWALLSMRQQSAVEDRSSTSAGSGLLRAYFPSDVASAASIVTPTAPVCGTTRIPVVELQGETAQTVYVVDRMEELDGTLSSSRDSLWRRECSTAGVVEQQQVVQAVDPARVSVDCDPGPPSQCRTVRISVTRTDDPNHPIVLTSGLRVT